MFEIQPFESKIVHSGLFGQKLLVHNQIYKYVNSFLFGYTEFEKADLSFYSSIIHSYSQIYREICTVSDTGVTFIPLDSIIICSPPRIILDMSYWKNPNNYNKLRDTPLEVSYFFEK